MTDLPRQELSQRRDVGHGPDTRASGGAPKFKPGDRVRPIPEWRGEPQIPEGTVVKAVPYGKGQAILVEGAKSYVLAGCFELSQRSTE